MSAVEEYRMEVASRGLHPVTNDGSVLALVDAALTELEAENERMRRILGLMDECGIEEATYTVDHYGKYERQRDRPA